MSADNDDVLGQLTDFRTIASTGDDRQFRVYVTACAVIDNYPYHCELKVLSAIGDSEAIKAFWAILSSNRGGQFLISENVFDTPEPVKVISNTSCGYNIRQHHMGYNLTHLVATVDDDHFLQRITFAEVFKKLRSDRFTIPVLESWVKPLCDGFKKSKQLSDFKTYNCHAGQLTTSDAALKTAVEKGLKSGQLVIA